jgi:hypothetical protein
MKYLILLLVVSLVLSQGSGSVEEPQESRLDCIMGCMYNVHWQQVGNTFGGCEYKPSCLYGKIGDLIEENRPCTQDCLNREYIQGSGTAMEQIPQGSDTRTSSQ